MSFIVTRAVGTLSVLVVILVRSAVVFSSNYGIERYGIAVT